MTLVELIFITFLFLDIPIVITSLYFAYILLKRGQDPIYFNFGMSVLFLGLWAAASGFLLLIKEDYLVALDSSIFIFGLLTIHFFAIFTFYYPILRKNSNKKIIVLLHLITIALIISIFFATDLFIIDVIADNFIVHSHINSIGLIIYTAYFLVLIVVSFINLFYSYGKIDGTLKNNIKKIILGTGLAVIFNLIFSLVNYFFFSTNTNLIGVFFTFTVILYIYSILFKSP